MRTLKDYRFNMNMKNLSMKVHLNADTETEAVKITNAIEVKTGANVSWGGSALVVTIRAEGAEQMENVLEVLKTHKFYI